MRTGKPKDWTDEFWDGWVQGRELLREEVLGHLRTKLSNRVYSDDYRLALRQAIECFEHETRTQNGRA